MSYYRDDDYSQTTTTTYTEDDDSYRRGGYGGGGGYNDDRFTETTTTTTSYDRDDGYDRPPRPEGLPRFWYTEWDDSSTRWVFINEQSGERRWEFPRDDGYYEQQTTTTTYEDDSYGGGGGGYRRGGDDRVYESETFTEDVGYDRRGEGYYGDRIRNDVDNFPDDAANWAGRKVGEVEAIPGDIAQGFENVVEDVVDAPERLAGWAGRKVGDVERFDDNVDASYDAGKMEGRYGY